MESNNFKTLETINGIEYIFNHVAFRTKLRKVAKKAVDSGDFEKQEDFREDFASKVSVSTSALKQWESGRNGVSDLDRVKDLALHLGLKNYKQLLTQKNDNNSEENNMNNNLYIAEEKNAAREVFYAMIDVLKDFKDTEAYADCSGENAIPSDIDVFITQNKAEVAIKRARFDLPEKVFSELDSLFSEVSSTLPEEITCEKSYMRFMEVEHIADEYFQKLCSILKDYIR